MTAPANDRGHVEEVLARERAHFIAQVHAVPAARRSARPADGGWSAAEIVQHVSRVEAGVAKLVGAGATMPRTATAAELAVAVIDERKVQLVRDRSVKVQAPERTHPQQAMDADAALVQLAESRTALLAAFRTADPAVLDGVTWVHPAIGPLTLRAWVELVAHHDARHAQQVAALITGA